jgi:hypothetical protein
MADTAYNDALITSATTTQVVTGHCTLRRIIVQNVGTTATLDIYDAISGTTLKVYEWVSADGKQNFEVNMRLKNGLRIISGGTFGRVTVLYD